MSLDVSRIKVIAFDVFGTLVKFDGVPHEEIKAYADHIRKPEWSPLVLPDSWKNLKAFDDSQYTVDLLRLHQFMVVTLSNGPLGIQAHLLRNNAIPVDAIIPLEIARVFKPNPRAYQAASEILGIPPENWLMVTANEKFGDLEASKLIGMQSQLIRGDELPQAYNLASILGC